METFGQSTLSPSYNRRPHFNSLAPQSDYFIFYCVTCKSDVSISFKLLITGVGTTLVDDELAARASEFYKIGVVGKSQDGGWPSMLRTSCGNCRTQYLVYAGVQEVRNSVYSVTIQGITELRTHDN